MTSTDWKLPEVQQRYWPCFPPFVKRLILKNCYHNDSATQTTNGVAVVVGKNGTSNGILGLGGGLIGPPAGLAMAAPQGAGNPEEPHPFIGASNGWSS